MADTTSSVQSYYSSSDIVGRAMAALEAAGHDIGNVTVEMLHLVDQLHGGGLSATVAQAEMAGVSKGMRVLDAGCGVGGASRYLAHTYGCRVEAIDLTPEFVKAAEEFNRLSGISDRVSVRHGSATDLPFEDQSFDLVWCQNVTMNVEDKPRMFAEAFRVLAPGGRYTFSHVAQGPGGEPYFPLPWATEPSYSFLGTPKQVLDWLAGAGFVNIETRTEQGTPGSKRERPPGDLNSDIVMGIDMTQRIANGARSGAEGRIIGMVVVAERPV